MFTIKTVSVERMIEPSVNHCNIDGTMISNNKKCATILHFVHSFRPIYYFARGCGLMPFSIVPSNAQNERCEPRITKYDCLWLAISMCFYLTMMAYTFSGKITLPHESCGQLNAIVLGNHLLRLMILIFGIFALAMNMCNRYKLVNILNKFTIFDKKVSTICSQCELRINQIRNGCLFFLYKNNTSSFWYRWPVWVLISIAKWRLDVHACTV